MLFRDYILSPVERRTTDKLNKSIQIQPEGFLQMLTNNSYDRRFTNSWVVEECLEQFQKHVPSATVEISEVYVERKSIQRIDERQLTLVTDEELLDSPSNSLIASKAIVKIQAKGLSDSYNPALAIHLTDKGESVGFGGNVTVCNNFTILNPDRLFSTFQRHRNRTKERMTTKELTEQLVDLFPSTELILTEELGLIEELKQSVVTRPQWHSFSGALFGRIHYVNRMRLDRQIATVPAEVKALPITAAMMAEISAEGESPSYNVYEWDGELNNKWSLINFGTGKIKVENGANPMTVLQTNLDWTKMVMAAEFK